MYTYVWRIFFMTNVALWSSGEVGPPFACGIIKLADVPEMNYYASDNIGEVCCLGKHVFRGYLHDEAKTKEAIDSEGWLHTGDIGIWTDVSTYTGISCRNLQTWLLRQSCNTIYTLIIQSRSNNYSLIQCISLWSEQILVQTAFVRHIHPPSISKNKIFS